MKKIDMRYKPDPWIPWQIKLKRFIDNNPLLIGISGFIIIPILFIIFIFSINYIW